MSQPAFPYGHNRPIEFEDTETKPGDWIALSRKVREHPIVGCGQPVKPADTWRGAYSRFEAWFDLLCLAQYKPARVSNKGEVITLAVGQLLGARAYLAARWNWTEKTVRGYLDTLENEGMISRSAPSKIGGPLVALETEGAEKGPATGQQKAPLKQNKSNVITLCNYEKFQRISDAIEAYIADVRGSEKGQQRATGGPAKGQTLTKERKKQVSEEEKDICAGDAAPGGAEFEEFWQAFPVERRRGKGECRDLFLKIVNGKHAKRRASAADLVAAIKAGNGIDPDFPPMPSTWLNGGRWEDAPRSAPDDVPTPVNGKAWGWWRPLESRLKAQPIARWREAVALHKPNGTWPWWILGAPPGHPECVVPAEIVTENNYAQIYRGRVNHA